MTLMSSKDSALDFIVKFSPSVCVAVVATLTREVAVRSFAYQAHGTNPADIHGHDKTLNQQIMHACSGSPLPPPMINHLTSSIIANAGQGCYCQSRVFCMCIAVLTTGYDMSCICIGKGSDGTDHSGECTIFIVSYPETVEI